MIIFQKNYENLFDIIDAIKWVIWHTLSHTSRTLNLNGSRTLWCFAYILWWMHDGCCCWWWRWCISQSHRQTIRRTDAMVHRISSYLLLWSIRDGEMESVLLDMNLTTFFEIYYSSFSGIHTLHGIATISTSSMAFFFGFDFGFVIYITWLRSSWALDFTQKTLHSISNYTHSQPSRTIRHIDSHYIRLVRPRCRLIFFDGDAQPNKLNPFINERIECGETKK